MAEEVDRTDEIREKIKAAVAGVGAKIVAGCFGVRENRLGFYEAEDECCPIGCLVVGAGGETIVKTAATILSVSDQWIAAFTRGFDGHECGMEVGVDGNPLKTKLDKKAHALGREFRQELLGGGP